MSKSHPYVDKMRKISKDDIIYFLLGLRKKHSPCPYCGNSPFIYDKKHLVIDICKCQECGLFFVNPVYVSSENAGTFYDNAYSSDATYIPDADALELMKQRNFRGSHKDYNDRLTVIRKLVNGDKLLEFGSSWGYFLFQSQAYGFCPTGVELSAKRSAFGHDNLGINISPDLDSIHDKFDVIYSAHVLEHLLDLSDIFKKFHERLKPNGSLIIEVPNFDPDTKGKSVYSIIGKVHPLGFSKHFFESNLPKHGFSKLDIAGNYGDLIIKPEYRLPLADVIILHAKKG